VAADPKTGRNRLAAYDAFQAAPQEAGRRPPEVEKMEEKRKRTRSGSAVVTEGSAQAALRRGQARELTPEEEKVMRLRLGASPPAPSALEWTEEELSEDLQIELQAMQIEAWMKWKAHLAAQRAPRPAASTVTAPARSPAPRPSRTKEKIIRALRRKP
jgi:hypothetical protein